MDEFHMAILIFIQNTLMEGQMATMEQIPHLKQSQVVKVCKVLKGFRRLILLSGYLFIFHFSCGTVPTKPTSKKIGYKSSKLCVFCYTEQKFYSLCVFLRTNFLRLSGIKLY